MNVTINVNFRKVARDGDHRPLRAASTGQVLAGLVKQCAKFVTMNVRDVPHIRAKTGLDATPQDRASVLGELNGTPPMPGGCSRRHPS
jgi:hypothetical protein